MDPTVAVSTLDARATRARTPAGDGSMVWRMWGAGPPLVLLHGASGSWTHWIRNIAALAARFRLYVPDLPGFGDSDAPPPPHTADALAAIVTAGLDALVPAGRTIDIAGFSFGGIVGTLVAAQRGRGVRRLVLIGAGGFGLPRAPMRALARIGAGMTDAEIEAAHRENLHVLMIARPDRIDDLAVRLQIDNVRRARFKSGGIPDSDTLVAALPSVTARVAGIWGAHDAFVGGALEERRRRLAEHQPDLDFRVLDAAHWVVYEAADEVNAALLEILR